MQKRILILSNHFITLYNFRKELIQKLNDEGHEVYISIPMSSSNEFFSDMGCKIIETPVDRRGINPVKEFSLIIKYIKIIKKIKPDVVLTYTIKPNVYGGIACTISKIPYIVNITGLGTAVENQGLLQKITLFLYKISMKRAKCIFFQNNENRQFFINNYIDVDKSRLIPGSGVNLKKYNFEEYPKDSEIIQFVFIGRIMKDKGIDELLEAAKTIKEQYPNVQFNLVGYLEENYKKKLEEFQNKDIIKYYGYQKDVHSFIKNSHAIINPSYHEGMSNVLLESASTGRPVLASNISGCKETLDEGISGFKFEAKNVNSLIETIIKFIELPYEKKKSMGIAGRRKMEREFDRTIVVDAYMKEISKIIHQQKEGLV